MIRREYLLPQRIQELARTQPSTLAMQNVDGTSVNWQQLNQACLLWAGALRNAGIGPGDMVATLMPNSFDAFYAWLGVSWLRAVEVPMNTLHRGTMLAYLIENSGAELLLTTKACLEQVVGVQETLTRLKTVVVTDASAVDDLPALEANVIRGQSFLDAAPAEDIDGPDVWDTAAMVFTSGTTGPSKGVLVPWGELYGWLTYVPDDLLSAGQAYYSVFPTFHISGKTSLYTAAHNSAHLVIRQSFSVSEFWNDVRKFDIEAVGLTGPMAAMLMSAPPQQDDHENTLRSVLLGPVIPDIEDFKRRFGVERYATGYGTTEVGFPVVSPWNPPNSRTCGQLRQGSPDYEVRIVDEHDHPLPPGAVGELIVRTGQPWTMNSGYRGMGDATAAAWRNGWFHTGDALIQDDDGWFYLVDRIKDTLRRRGENISSVELEQDIMTHPAVAECAVIGVPSELGEDDVKAVIVIGGDSSLTPEELIDYLTPRLASFMLPRYIEFVPALPRTDGTYRIRKIALRSNPVNADTWDRLELGNVQPADSRP